MRRRRPVWLKWIVCRVVPAERDGFSRSQEAWSAIAARQGFLGQCGGWDRDEPGTACILAAWRDASSYAAFMEDAHDAVVGVSGQDRTYDGIEVALVEGVRPARRGRRTLAASMDEAAALRVSDCRVRPDRRAHFLAAQNGVWEPGMERSAGMLGSRFGAVRADPERFLAFSWWASGAAIDRYRAKQFPGLRREAEADRDLVSTAGRRVELVPAWTVLPRAPG